jgi:hypothetical protein
VINPGIIASSYGRSTGASTATAAGITPNSNPDDYVTVEFTSSTNVTLYSTNTPIVFSWFPLNYASLVTGYNVVISYTDAYGDAVNQSYQNITGTSVSYTPPVGSANGTYTCTVVAVTANGATGQPATSTLTAYVANGSAESSGTSGNTSVAYTVVSNGIVSTLPAGEVIFGETSTSSGHLQSAP